MAIADPTKSIVLPRFTEKRPDISGKQFGRLKVEKWGGRDKANRTLWLCRCECGKSVLAEIAVLNRGHVKSCGCLKIDNASALKRTHSMRHTKIWHVWSSMCARCHCQTDKAYSKYGGRGIVVCERWRTSFSDFFADMGDRPSDKHSIDRIDNNGNYEPGNCRWATRVEQNSNKRNNRYLTKDGITLSVIEWSSRLGISGKTINERIRRGWSDERALTHFSTS